MGILTFLWPLGCSKDFFYRLKKKNQNFSFPRKLKTKGLIYNKFSKFEILTSRFDPGFLNGAKPQKNWKIRLSRRDFRISPKIYANSNNEMVTTEEKKNQIRVRKRNFERRGGGKKFEKSRKRIRRNLQKIFEKKNLKNNFSNYFLHEPKRKKIANNKSERCKKR